MRKSKKKVTKYTISFMMSLFIILIYYLYLDVSMQKKHESTSKVLPTYYPSAPDVSLQD